MELLKEVEEKIDAILPKEAEITKIELEGPEVVLYTRNPQVFFKDEQLVATLAKEIKKKINRRSDKNLLVNPSEAEVIIREIVPEDARIDNIFFNEPFHEVEIEALKPGLVIGKGGETTKQIILKTGWTPNILRSPTTPSETLQGIRYYLRKHCKERKKIMKNLAERIFRTVDVKRNWIRLTALGGFREVGRSSILVETAVSKILLDCGINVASQEEPFPYLDALNFPLSELDAVIVSHAHLDHSGFVPYLFKMGYRGAVYCTAPTRDLMALLQFDYIDVNVKERNELPYAEKDVKEMVKHCVTRDYREVTDISPDVRITLHNAAHILGSASVHMHIGEGNHNIIYTADLKYGFTRLFDSIDIRYPRLETLIIESTYGGKEDIQPNRDESEARLLQVIKETIAEKGNVLIPVFAVGRAQEIMLVLENFYRNNMLDAKCYVDGMTREASAIHTAYPEYLRKNVQRRILQNDSPFKSEIFQEVPNDKDKIIEEGSAIILASSGMLTGGPSVEYLYKMAEDPKNTLIFVGYQGEGSLGRKLQNGAKEIPIVDEKGKTKALKINLRIETIEGFSGHSDRRQLTAYVGNLKPRPRNIIVNHGDRNKCLSLAKFLGAKYRANSTAPQNLDSIRLL